MEFLHVTLLHITEAFVLKLIMIIEILCLIT